MAYAVKRNKIWYVRFKDEKNVWQYIADGIFHNAGRINKRVC
jgi:hypothetical protein